MEFHTTVGLFRFAGICVGEVGEVNKVSCTHGCSDHCHRLQHGQVIGMDVSSDILNIQFNMACYRTMAQAGKAREGGRTRRSMAKQVSWTPHYTHGHQLETKPHVCASTPTTCNDQRI